MAASHFTRQGLPIQMISNAFLHQYYNVLHKSPEMAYRFYKDTSFVSRPNSDGTMITVTTYPKIMEIVKPLEFSNCTFEIHTSCGQPSQMDGLIVFTTGCVISTQGWTRGFSQSFLLAPQEEGGFLVMNDVFQFVSGTPQVGMNICQDHGNDHKSGVSAGAKPAAAGDEREGNPAAGNNRSCPSETNDESGTVSQEDDAEGWVKVEAESEGNAPVEERKFGAR